MAGVFYFQDFWFLDFFVAPGGPDETEVASGPDDYAWANTTGRREAAALRELRMRQEIGLVKTPAQLIAEAEVAELARLARIEELALIADDNEALLLILRADAMMGLTRPLRASPPGDTGRLRSLPAR
jgi:hypothetical protein